MKKPIKCPYCKKPVVVTRIEEWEIRGEAVYRIETIHKLRKPKKGEV